MVLKTNPLDNEKGWCVYAEQLATLGQDPNPGSQTHNLFTISKITSRFLCGYYRIINTTYFKDFIKD